MRIAWFTPFEKKSAIGKYSKCAVTALSKVLDVDLFVYCKSNDPTKDAIMHTSSVNCIYYSSSAVVSKLSEYDLCIYNMGDNVEYHGMIYDILKLKPGIVIAHDICMHNFIRGYYIVYKNNPNKYVELLQEKYGETEARHILEAANCVNDWMQIDLLKYNMLDEIFSNALGVIVHSEYHKNYVLKDYHGPVQVVPLLYENEMLSQKGKVSKSSKAIELLTVGVVNPNKHVDAIIKAIGESDLLRNAVKYTVIGALNNKEYVEQLNSLIRNYDLQDNVKLLDYVDDKTLQTYYDNADLITNLRWPALEGGSASLVEQLQCGKAIIAVNTGVYAEVPDDCIYKINPDDMENELCSLLENIVKGELDCTQCGKNALEYSKEYLSSDNYIEKVEDFVQRITFSLPLHEVMEECNKFTDCMCETKIFSMIGEEMEILYNGVRKE